jgi:type IV pilus assembly protein PilB
LAQGFTLEDVESGITVFRAVGCDHCTDGYRGRTGIFEVLPVTEALVSLILSGANAHQLSEQARREGVLNMRQSGLRKIKAGITSLEELNRVTTD